MLKKIVNKILGGDIPSPTIPQWIAAFAAVVVFRSFLETFSSPTFSGIIPHSIHRVHFFLFFIATIFLAALTVAIFTKQRGGHVLNLALYGFPIIFLAPIVDLIASGGQGTYIQYIYGTHTTLFYDFITFMGTSDGATTGIRVEIFVILCGIAWYVWMKKRGIAATLGAVATFYVFGFIFGALPGFLYTISHAPSSEAVSALGFMHSAALASNIPTNILHGELTFESYATLLALSRSALMAQIFFILAFVLGLVWFLYAHNKLTKVILKNIRVTRVLFAFALIALGIIAARSMFSVVLTWVDWISITVLGISWLSACMFAVQTNDLADIEIDNISNPERPLPKGEITEGEMRDTGHIWLLLSLVGSYTVGYFVFFMNTIFISAYYLYSVYPFRLKRIPILSSFLISVAVLVTFLAGFFFTSPDKSISQISILSIVGIIVVFTLGVNIRDIKDAEGDRRAGIQTLPVIFGEYGSHIVGALLALSFLLAPLFFSFFTNYAIATPAALISYWLCVRQPYKEHYIFILFFAFCIASILFK